MPALGRARAPAVRLCFSGDFVSKGRTDEQGNRGTGGDIPAGDSDPPQGRGLPAPAETLRQTSVTRNIWSLLACQNLYLTGFGPVVTVGEPLISWTVDVPPFDRNSHRLAGAQRARLHLDRWQEARRQDRVRQERHGERTYKIAK